MFAKIFALASLVAVSAFAPASRMATSSALKMSFEDAIGAQAPLVRSSHSLQSTYNFYLPCLLIDRAFGIR